MLTKHGGFRAAGTVKTPELEVLLPNAVKRVLSVWVYRRRGSKIMPSRDRIGFFRDEMLDLLLSGDAEKQEGAAKLAWFGLAALEAMGEKRDEDYEGDAE